MKRLKKYAVVLAILCLLLAMNINSFAKGPAEDGEEVQLSDLVIKFLAVPEYEPTRYTKSNGGKFAPEELEKGLLIGAEMKLGEGNPEGMMAPLKHSFADIAADVSFNTDTKDIVILFNGLTLKMKAGSLDAVLYNGKTNKTLKIPKGLAPYFLQVEGETTPDQGDYYACYLPVKFTAEALGGTVTWDEQMHRMVMAFAFYYSDATATPKLNSTGIYTTKNLEDGSTKVSYEALKSEVLGGRVNNLITAARNVIAPCYQNADGGWSKTNSHYDLLADDFTKLLTPGYSTFDNGTTHGQIRLLSRIIRLSKEYPDEFAGYEDDLEAIELSFWKSLKYILDAQDDEDGGWPQYYPYAIGYFKNITYNDNAMTTIMQTLYALTHEVGNLESDLCNEFKWVRDALEEDGSINGVNMTLLENAWDSSLKYTLNAQIIVDDELTGWAQQYDPDNDPVTGRPIPTVGRSYELPSIATNESLTVFNMLTNIINPTPEIEDSIEGFLKWTKKIGATGYSVAGVSDRTRELGTDRRYIKNPKATAISYGRFYGLDTTGDYYDSISIENPGEFYMIFSGRDGIAKLDHNIGGHERRSSYSFVTTSTITASAKDRYEKWKNAVGITDAGQEGQEDEKDD